MIVKSIKSNSRSVKSKGFAILSVAFVFLMIIGVFSPVISGTDAGTNTGTRQQDQDYILRVAMQDDIKTLNPLVTSDSWTWNVIEYIYDKPVKSDPITGELIPYIAVGSASGTGKGLNDVWGWEDLNTGVFGNTPVADWEPGMTGVSEATIFYDFTNVTWHDGMQMSIRDIQFAYHVQALSPTGSSDVNCLMDLGGEFGTNYSNTNYLHIQKVYESADGLQAALRFEIQTPFESFFRSTLSVLLLPYHVWGSTVSGQAYDNTMIWCDPGYSVDNVMAWDVSDALAWHNPTSIGSGPMKYDSWNMGVSSKIITYRDHFYRENWNPDYDINGIAKQPTIEAIVFKIYKTAEQAVLALRNNDIDYIAWSLPPTFVQEVIDEPDIGIKQSMSSGFYYMGYNMRPNKRSFGYDDNGVDVGKPLRKAIAHCIDKDLIVQRLLLGFGSPGDGPISATSEWYNDSIPQYDFDPEEAKTILENAGYQLTNPTIDPGQGNWWLNPDGSNIGNSEGGKIEILTPPADYDPIRAQAGLMIAMQMQEIGIYAESIAMDFGTIVNHIDYRDFDMYILGWNINSAPPNFMYAFFHSDNAAAGQNYPGYSNSSFDAIIDTARASGDDALRLELINDAQAAIAYDLPYDVLYFKTNIEAYRSDRFTGWVSDSSGSIYNWRSILELRPPSNMWLEANFVNVASSIGSNATTDVEVLVTKNRIEVDSTITRMPVDNAFVRLAVSDGSLSAYSGTTGSNGVLRVTFTAPYAQRVNEFNSYGSSVLIEIASAELYGYDDAPSKITMLTVYPDDIDFLTVHMEAEPMTIDDTDATGALGISNIVVSVTDRSNDPIIGAEVTIQLDSLYSPSPSISPVLATTGSDGTAVFTFEAAELWDEEDREYSVSVLATKDDYESGTQSIVINVVDAHIYIPPNSDIDGDGVNNTDDDFPTDPAASVDTDGDGKPDDWNEGYTAEDSTTGLILDEDDDGDGIPDDEILSLDSNSGDDDETSLVGTYWWLIVILIVVFGIMIAIYFFKEL